MRVATTPSDPPTRNKVTCHLAKQDSKQTVFAGTQDALAIHALKPPTNLFEPSITQHADLLCLSQRWRESLFSLNRTFPIVYSIAPYSQQTSKMPVKRSVVLG